MNNKRRTTIKHATNDFLEKVDELLTDYRETLEGVLNEEQEAYDNMTESMQESEKGEACETAISALEDYIENLDIDNLRYDYLEVSTLYEDCGIEGD